MTNTPLYDALLKKANNSPTTYNHQEVWNALRNSEISYAVCRQLVLQRDNQIEMLTKQILELECHKT